ncbi:hypothetical protein CERZMDRAFT_96872 [Cercospora zeae-maydis SCOH1-5]|uniref:Uncharacterized protein n=1 Tax=Cercospora zeae-maydis SCOH1-5 TaxID=717836 RepID=A0A6A6FIE4_9PEZI|nr:hypothetical protein CERZMDRAFT_96872 [Cercospora zeae-maydis SCOH1-5]
MCKTQTWKYQCGCSYNHRLSTCRGFVQTNGHTTCQGGRYIPVIKCDMHCACCLKRDVLEACREYLTKELKEARSSGAKTGPIRNKYFGVRSELKLQVPKNSLTVNRPRPQRTWTPNRPSPLRRELRAEDLLEEEAKREESDRMQTSDSELDIGTDSEPSEEGSDSEM